MELNEESGEAKSTLSMPAFISKRVRQTLYDLGYPPEVVDAMDPQEAQEILSSRRKFDATGTAPAR